MHITFAMSANIGAILLLAVFYQFHHLSYHGSELLLRLNLPLAVVCGLRASILRLAGDYTAPELLPGLDIGEFASKPLFGLTSENGRGDIGAGHYLRYLATHAASPAGKTLVPRC